MTMIQLRCKALREDEALNIVYFEKREWGVILAKKQKINIRRLLRSVHPNNFLTRFDKDYAKRIARKQLTRFSLYLNSSNQYHKGNDMNCCCVEKLAESLYRTVLKTTKSLAITFFTYSNICQLWRILLYDPFPNICIISPLKAYFDFITNRFVTMINICIIRSCCCPFSVGKIVAT